MDLPKSYIKISNTFSQNPEDKFSKYIIEIERLTAENADLTREVLTLHEGYNMMKSRFQNSNARVTINEIPVPTNNNQNINQFSFIEKRPDTNLDPKNIKDPKTLKDTHPKILEPKSENKIKTETIHIPTQASQSLSHEVKPSKPDLRLCTLEFPALAPMISLYKERINNLISERTSLTDELTYYMSTLKNQCKENTILREELEEKSKEIIQSDRKVILRKELEHSDYEQRILALAKDNKEMVDKYRSLSAKLQEKIADEAMVIEKDKKIESKITNLQNLLSKKESEITILKDEVSNLKRVSSIESKHREEIQEKEKRKDEELNTKKIEIKSIASNLEHVKKELLSCNEKFAEEITKLKNENSLLKKQLQDSISKGLADEKEKAKLTEAVRNHEKEISFLTSSLKSLKKENLICQETIDNFKREDVGQVKELNKYKDKISLLHSEIDRLSNELEIKKSIIESLDSKYQNQIEGTRTELGNEIIRLRTEISAIRATNEDLITKQNEFDIVNVLQENENLKNRMKNIKLN